MSEPRRKPMTPTQAWVRKRTEKARAAYEKTPERAERARSAYDSQPHSPPPVSPPGPGVVSSQDSKDLDAMTNAIRAALGEMVGSMDALSENLLRRDRTEGFDIQVTGRDENQAIASLRVKRVHVDLQ